MENKLKTDLISVIFGLLFIIFVIAMSYVGVQIDKYYTQNYLIEDCYNLLK